MSIKLSTIASLGVALGLLSISCSSQNAASDKGSETKSVLSSNLEENKVVERSVPLRDATINGPVTYTRYYGNGAAMAFGGLTIGFPTNGFRPYANYEGSGVVLFGSSKYQYSVKVVNENITINYSASSSDKIFDWSNAEKTKDLRRGIEAAIMDSIETSQTFTWLENASTVGTSKPGEKYGYLVTKSVSLRDAHINGPVTYTQYHGEGMATAHGGLKLGIPDIGFRPEANYEGSGDIEVDGSTYQYSVKVVNEDVTMTYTAASADRIFDWSNSEVTMNARRKLEAAIMGTIETSHTLSWQEFFYADKDETNSIVGSYENHLYDNDPAAKNDWHFAEVSKAAEGVYTWTNHAGVSWTLTQSAVRDEFDVSNCPYGQYTKAHVIRNTDGSVAKIMGPWDESYDRKYR